MRYYMQKGEEKEKFEQFGKFPFPSYMLMEI
jgi:hypothetical protein